MNAPPKANYFSLPANWQTLFDLGFSVIPIKRPTKNPLSKWKAYQTERAGFETLQRWSKQDCNIGIVTGAVSGVIVLDLDNQEAIAEAEALGMPDTLAVSTPRGMHVYFKHPGYPLGNRAGVRPGWDIRGDGGFVVTAGSYFIPTEEERNDGKVEGEYPKQTTRTNAADMVAEGDTKPESAYGWTMQTVTPKVIAHWVPASRQILDDAPMLRDTIDTELRYGLELKEDAQLLFGDGTGQNLSGLVTNATAYSAPFEPADFVDMLDQIALAILQTTLADYTPTGIIMHPSDWMRIRLLKDTNGKYLLGDPGAAVPPVLFGLPVVATTSMTVDKFLVGDFQRAATIYDRWEPRVEVSTEHDDFFTRNLVAILAEERLALATKNALALTYGDFGND